MSKRTRGEVRGLPESKPVVYYFLVLEYQVQCRSRKRLCHTLNTFHHHNINERFVDMKL